MKIWGEVPKVNGVYKTTKANKSESISKVRAKNDVISISPAGRDYQVALKAVKDVPDIRTDKVGAIMEQYNAGSYNVNGQEIADKIVSSLIDKKI